MMDRTDMPSNEMRERIDEDTFELVSRAIAARDAEWVAAATELLKSVTISEARFFDMLKARMTGDK